MAHHEGTDENLNSVGIYDWDHYEDAPCHEKIVVDTIEFAFSAISGIGVGKGFAITIAQKLGHGTVKATIRDLAQNIIGDNCWHSHSHDRGDEASILNTAALIFRNVWDALSWRSIRQALWEHMNWKDVVLLTASIIAQPHDAKSHSQAHHIGALR